MELVKRLFQTKEGGMLLSLVFGIALTTLFRKKCIGDKCIIVKTKINEVTKQTYHLPSGKCVKFEPKITKCEFK